MYTYTKCNFRRLLKKKKQQTNQSHDFSGKINGTENHYIKWSKPESERNPEYFLLYVEPRLNIMNVGIYMYLYLHLYVHSVCN